MGFLRTPKYQRDPELEKQLKEQREEEERIKQEQEKLKKKERKDLKLGMLGQLDLYLLELVVVDFILKVNRNIMGSSTSTSKSSGGGMEWVQVNQWLWQVILD